MRRRPRLPQPLIDEYEWQDRGRCRTAAVSTFFDLEDSRGRERSVRTDAAKRICRGCEVRAQCLRHALAAEDFGVWGGTTAAEREELRRRAVPDAS